MQHPRIMFAAIGVAVLGAAGGITAAAVGTPTVASAAPAAGHSAAATTVRTARAPVSSGASRVIANFGWLQRPALEDVDGRADAQCLLHGPFRGAFSTEQRGRIIAALKDDADRIADLVHRRLVAGVEEHDGCRDQGIQCYDVPRHRGAPPW